MDGRPSMLLKISLLLCVFVSHEVSSQIDRKFCDSKGRTGSSNLNPPMPTMPTEIIMDMESFTSGNQPQNVVSVHMLYSKSKAIFYEKTKSLGAEYYLYMFQKKNLIMDTTVTNGEKQCVADALSDQNKTKLESTFVLPEGDNLFMQFSQYDPPQYLYKASVRGDPETTTSTPKHMQEFKTGIPAHCWKVCGYMDAANYTLVKSMCFSSGDYQMPGFKGPVLVAELLDYKYSISNMLFHTRVDISNFQSRIPTAEDVFMVPRDMWCPDRKEATNLPKIGTVFQFSADQIDLFDTNLEFPQEPSLTHFKEEYVDLLKTFELDQETTGDDRTSAFKHKTFHDFRTGLQYEFNPTVGTCVVSKIGFGPDFSVLNDSNVQMKTPGQFFDLTGQNYQYMGEHENMDRDVYCDVFTTVKSVGTANNPSKMIYTWYFATKDWMTKVMKFTNYYPMPVRLISTKTGDPSDTKVMDFYDFTTNPSADSLTPDLSLCFPVGKEMYLEMLLDARYSYIYGPNGGNFLADFTDALIQYTGVFSLTRITDIQVEPTINYRTVVQFTVLERPSKVGNVDMPAFEIDNAEFYKRVQNVIAQQTFVINIKNMYGSYNVKALRIRKRNFLISDSPSTTTPMPSYGTTGTTGFTHASTGSNGYSSGAMAGVAVAMLVVGFFLAFGSVILYSFLRRRPRDNPNEYLDKVHYGDVKDTSDEI